MLTAVAALAVADPGRAQDASLVCDTPTNEMEPDEYRYRWFPDEERCEGRITVGVSTAATPPAVRSATYGAIEYDKGADETLYAAVSPAIGAPHDRVTLRGRSIDPDSTYRLEARLAPGETFSWSLGLIREIGPDADEMALLARLDDGSEGRDAPIVPVRVGTSSFAWPDAKDDERRDEEISVVITSESSYAATVVDFCRGERDVVREDAVLSPYDPLIVSLPGAGCEAGRFDLHVTDGDDRSVRYSYELIR